MINEYGLLFSKSEHPEVCKQGYCTSGRGSSTSLCRRPTRHDQCLLGSPRRRCPAGTVVATTSVNRMAAVYPRSDGHDEASGPDIHHEAFDDLGNDHDPAMTSKELDTDPQLKAPIESQER